MCGGCHAGYGLIEGDFSAEKIDCLICHAPDYNKTATGPGPLVDATAAARNVTVPTRAMCLRCHAKAGGGDNRKRGDIEFNMTTDLELEMMSNPKPAIGDLDAAMGATDVPEDLDIHMSKGMTCQACHEFEDHHVPGRGMDLRVDDTDTILSCTKCHSSKPHLESSAVGSFINTHTDRIYCTVCHITSYGKDEPVEVARNWELPFSPIQVWWNRQCEILDLEDPAVFDSNGDVIMARPVGDIGDSTSKIYAARLHRGRSPWNGTHMLPFHVKTAKLTKNMTEAIRVATTVTYDPVQYVNSTRYMGIFHGVAPKEDALTCSDCHEDHKLDYEALGYNVEKDASGNLISATKPEGGMNLVNLEGFSHDTLISEYEDTETCLECHRQIGEDFVDSIHNTWLGTATNVVGKVGMETGKLVAVNEFCGAIESNEAMCGKCHAGYGLIEYDFSVEKIDCLICHAPDYAKTATGSALSIDATTAAARNVTSPTREMCLRCHAKAGGGDNRKRGDIELGMMTDLELEMMSDPKPAVGDLDAAMGATDVSRDLDVHMSMDMTCQDCHIFEDHHVPGRGMDLRVDDTDTVLSCDDAKCHGSAPHTGTSIEDALNNMHTDKLACTVCHITSYGKEEPVEVARNWELPFAPGMLTKESNPAPIQVWWNRQCEILDLEDPAVFDSNGDVRFQWRCDNGEACWRYRRSHIQDICGETAPR
jgi:nitrate reductase cytochrome c-type subunit